MELSRRLAIAALLATVPQVAWAQPRRRIAPGESLRGRFIQERHLQGFQRPLRSEGAFLLVPDRGLIWRAEQPFAVTTVITPSGVVQEVDGNEPQDRPKTQAPFIGQLYGMMSAALAGDWTALRNHFAVTQQGDERRWQAVLTPL